MEGQTRMTYIPESYFKLLEGRLGHTGPYTLLWGGLITALSKEWLVLGPEMFWAISAAIFYSHVFNSVAAPFSDREDLLYWDIRNQRVEAWKSYKIGLASSEIDGIARLKEQTRVSPWCRSSAAPTCSWPWTPST